jgi:hypothetical protein
MRKVWTYFDRAEENYGRPWPIRYRMDEQSRLARLREFGLKAIPALSYAHKPGWPSGSITGAWSSSGAFRMRCTAPPFTPNQGLVSMCAAP